MLTTTLLAAALLLAEADRRVLTTAPPEVAEQAASGADAEAEPEVIMRGRTTTIIVKGGDVEALKTLGVNPPDGVRLGEIKVLPSGKDGRKAVSVAVTVDATAKPGERELTLTVPPTVMGSGARPGDDATAKQMQLMMQEIVKRETRPAPAGALHINSHDVKVTKVEVVAGEDGPAVRVTVEDAAGDVAADAPPKAETGIALVAEPLVSEVHCGDDVFYGVLEESSVRERKPPALVLEAHLDREALAGKTGCELRVRAEDKAGNLSDWVPTKLEPR